LASAPKHPHTIIDVGRREFRLKLTLIPAKDANSKESTDDAKSLYFLDDLSLCGD